MIPEKLYSASIHHDAKLLIKSFSFFSKYAEESEITSDYSWLPTLIDEESILFCSLDNYQENTSTVYGCMMKDFHEEHLSLETISLEKLKFIENELIKLVKAIEMKEDSLELSYIIVRPFVINNRIFIVRKFRN